MYGLSTNIGHFNYIIEFCGKIYVMGGFSGFNKAIVHKMVEVYDPAADSWSAKSDAVNDIGRY